MKEFVTVKDLAAELGLERSTLRKYILKNGFKPHNERPPESRGQATLALTMEEADAVKALRTSQGWR